MAHSYAKFGKYPELAHRIANVALERAITLSDFFSIFYLLEDGADVNTQTLPGATALIVAAHAGQAEVVRRLLTVPNIHPDFQEKDGWTALMFAAYSGNVDIVYMLLDHGVDMGVQNVQGLTALDVAKQFNQREVVHILEERAVQVSCFSPFFVLRIDVSIIGFSLLRSSKEDITHCVRLYICGLAAACPI